MPVELDVVRIVAITAAGFGAGFVNSIVGSGTLISFPTLLGVGYPGKIANITNNTGLVTGSFSAVAAQRNELKGQSARLRKVVPASLVGGTTGALLLLLLPNTYFKRVVPFLVLLGVALVIVGPWVQKRVRDRAASRARPVTTEHVSPLVLAAIALAGVYGGYFGAAQGIILIGLLGIGFDDSMARLNAVKNVLAGTVNLVAAIIFVLHGGVVWSAAALLAVGSSAGGVTGSRVGRRIPPNVLRGIIVVVGLVVASKLLFWS